MTSHWIFKVSFNESSCTADKKRQKHRWCMISGKKQSGTWRHSYCIRVLRDVWFWDSFAYKNAVATWNCVYWICFVPPILGDEAARLTQSNWRSPTDLQVELPSIRFVKPFVSQLVGTLKSHDLNFNAFELGVFAWYTCCIGICGSTVRLLFDAIHPEKVMFWIPRSVSGCCNNLIFRHGQCFEGYLCDSRKVP